MRRAVPLPYGNPRQHQAAVSKHFYAVSQELLSVKLIHKRTNSPRMRPSRMSRLHRRLHPLADVRSPLRQRSARNSGRRIRYNDRPDHPSGRRQRRLRAARRCEEQDGGCSRSGASGRHAELRQRSDHRRDAEPGDAADHRREPRFERFVDLDGGREQSALPDGQRHRSADVRTDAPRGWRHRRFELRGQSADLRDRAGARQYRLDGGIRRRTIQAAGVAGRGHEPRAGDEPERLQPERGHSGRAVLGLGERRRPALYQRGRLARPLGAILDPLAELHPRRTNPGGGRRRALRCSGRWARAGAGCVEERPSPYLTTDTAASSSNPDTLFVPYLAPDEAGGPSASPATRSRRRASIRRPP